MAASAKGRIMNNQRQSIPLTPVAVQDQAIGLLERAKSMLVAISSVANEDHDAVGRCLNVASDVLSKALGMLAAGLDFKRCNELSGIIFDVEALLLGVIALEPGTTFAEVAHEANIALEMVQRVIDHPDSFWSACAVSMGSQTPDAARSGVSSAPTLTWDTELPEGGDVALDFMRVCTWEIDTLTGGLVDVSERMRCATEMTPEFPNLVRSFAVRVAQLDSLLMSYLTNDSITLNEARQVLYGRCAPAGSEVAV
jgi:hypothetical protein